MHDEYKLDNTSNKFPNPVVKAGRIYANLFGQSTMEHENEKGEKNFRF